MPVRAGDSGSTLLPTPNPALLRAEPLGKCSSSSHLDMQSTPWGGGGGDAGRSNALSEHKKTSATGQADKAHTHLDVQHAPGRRRQPKIGHEGQRELIWIDQHLARNDRDGCGAEVERGAGIVREQQGELVWVDQQLARQDRYGCGAGRVESRDSDS